MEKYEQPINNFVALYDFSNPIIIPNENEQQTQNQRYVIELVHSRDVPFEFQQGRDQNNILLHGAEKEILSTNVIFPLGLNPLEAQVNTQHQNGGAEEDHNVNFSFPLSPNIQQIQSQNMGGVEESHNISFESNHALKVQSQNNANFSFPPGPSIQQIFPPVPNIQQIQSQNMGGAEETHNISFESNHAKQVQSQNNSYFSFPPGPSIQQIFPPVPNIQQIQSQNMGGAEETHNISFESNHAKQVQSQNNSYFSFPPGPSIQQIFPPVPNIQQIQSQNMGGVEESHNISFEFNHVQQVQSHNSSTYLNEAEDEDDVNLSFLPGPNAPFDSHQQNQIPQSLQSLPSQSQFFQSSPVLREDLGDAQSIADFVNDQLKKGVRGVTCESVDKLRKRYKGLELFTKIRESTFCEKGYKKSKGKCEWKQGLESSFLSFLKRHKAVVRKLTTNRGKVKSGLWEYVAYTLSQNGHKNFSPLQCSRKWKNIKREYKKVLDDEETVVSHTISVTRDKKSEDLFGKDLDALSGHEFRLGTLNLDMKKFGIQFLKL
ncbi:hypothetical protein RhiirA1_489461 [Rhizophagus irregularis]|uniref:Myb/SANT-like DNA-binding domain-containing protein n=1 Tax=Rhizophagus irregularis TaxID=588596 RepID=A0A2I1F8W6_9GLOM|nr:hypothetical protein RhiirA1_489461 [Rhizophagus irregularis]PKY30816.1 hypothetical protein RhiirB3_487469 [Rhizophagus irregularis]